MRNDCRTAALLLSLALLSSSPAAADFSGSGSGNETIPALIEHAEELLEDRTAALSDELREKLDALDLSTLGDDLKRIAEESASLSDEELRTELQQIAGDHGIALTDSQLDKALAFCRKLEKLGPEALEEKAGEIREKAERAGSAVRGLARVQQFFRQLRDAARSAAARLGDGIRALFSRLIP